MLLLVYIDWVSFFLVQNIVYKISGKFIDLFLFPNIVLNHIIVHKLEGWWKMSTAGQEQCINCTSATSRPQPVFVHKAFVLGVYLDSPFVPRLEMV